MGRLVFVACVFAVAGCHVLSRPALPEGAADAPRGVITSAPLRAGPQSPPSNVETRAPRPAVEVRPASREKGTAKIGSDDAPAADDPLEQAADCLGKGDSAGAAGHLARHVERHPDQVLFRLQLAELLFNQDRFADAGRHFQAAVGYAQDGAPAARKQLVHCHTRLMEVAQATADVYAERLHRGIGLYIVAGQLAGKAESAEVERLLCKAVTELKEAQAARPADARAAWYLYRVWTKLDQPRPAERALRQARAAAPFSELTAAESRELALAR
jgi:tetratricopeptide (TPR) repeat protein